MYIAGSYNGKTAKIYVNGLLEQELYLGGSINYSGINDFKIGNIEGLSSTRYWNGSIDEVKVWNRALSSEEINASYNAKIYCYDNKTEILTENGWKYFKDVTYEDKVATLNQSRMEFNTPTDIQDFAYTGDMYNVETEKGNLSVSPEHKVYAKIENELPAKPHRDEQSPQR